MKAWKPMIALALAGSVGAAAALTGTAGAGFPALPDNPHLGDLVLFSASDPDHGDELWRTDGTKNGTKRVEDINNGPNGSGPGFFARIGKISVFRAGDGKDPGDHGIELWRTDGTAAGTKLLKDIDPGLASSGPRYMTRIGKFVYFNANDGDHGAELWRTDGTKTGTKLVKNINPGPVESYPQGFTKLGKFIYFGARDEDHGYELWRSDGTRQGTKFVKDINPGAAPNGHPSMLIRLGDRIFFQAKTDEDGYQLWATDGTKRGTKLFKKIDPASDSFPGEFAKLGKLLLFQAQTSKDGAELWRTNGTKNGTKQVKNIADGNEGSYPVDLRRLGDVVVFTANDGSEADEHGVEVWRSDGTAQGTKLVKNIQPGFEGSGACAYAPLDGKLLFGAGEDDHGFELWSTNGKGPGTKLLKDIVPDSDSSDPFGCD